MSKKEHLVKEIKSAKVQLESIIDTIRNLCHEILEDPKEDSVLKDIAQDILLFWCVHLKQAINGNLTNICLEKILNRLDNDL